MQKEKKYKLGLALSGGGAKGFAHIGAIKAMEERGIYPDVISGTSAGAVVGALYAAGISPEEMLEHFMKHEVTDFLKFTLPNKAFLKYDGFAKFLKHILPVKNFEDLKIPLHVIASDFDNGKFVDFTSGELVPRIMASCTLPVIFEPVKIDGVRYVDGGLFKNLPVSPIKDLCQKVMAINVNPHLIDEHKENMLYVAAKSFQYVFKANVVEDIKLCDWILEIDSVLKYKTFELKKAREIYEIGYVETHHALDGIWNENNHFLSDLGKDYFKKKYLDKNEGNIT
ncbi:MAG: patatin-like phospholipase family protein [Parabacteroides sp.]|nr:patatin-like phospholipase family protein [Parabacteroides sp.]